MAVAGDVRRIVFSETGAVVATDSVSIHADYDNGITLRGMPQPWRSDHGDV